MPHESSRFGLTQNELLKITKVLQTFPEVDRGMIFGSRALGTFKQGSDIDIALFGKDLSDIITQISYQLNYETTLPYFFDLVNYNEISHPELKDHIDRVGLLFYSKISFS